jgi:hypothetical protein
MVQGELGDSEGTAWRHCAGTIATPRDQSHGRSAARVLELAAYHEPGHAAIRVGGRKRPTHGASRIFYGLRFGPRPQEK